MLLGERTVDHGIITRQSVLALLTSRSNVCCSGLPLHSSTSKMTYKRKITIVRLRNLKRSRRGTSSSQQPVNVTLEGLTSDTSGRTALGGRHDPSPPPPSPPTPSPPPPPPPANQPTLPEKTSLQLRMELLKRHAEENPATAASTQESDTFITVSLSQLNTLLTSQKCPRRTCRSTLKISIDGNTLRSECTKCHTPVTSAAPPSHYSDDVEYSMIRIREVYFSLISGTGFPGVQMSEALLTGGKMYSKSYYRYCRFLFRKMTSFYDEKIKEARDAVFSYYEEKLQRKPDKNGILDVDVSFDGSWMTRGHKSHIGIGFAVEVNTGFVLDFDVLSNYCAVCSSKPNKAHDCKKNFDGKAGAMEGEIAVRIWSRTTDYKMRFTTFVGDGDSSSYNNICRLNDGRGPYEVPVKKEECLNHVGKRMGTRLRKIKQEAYEEVTTKTGKKMRRSILGGMNMLTDEVIDKLSAYYGKAIRGKHGTVKEMQKAVWASYFHLTSKNEDHCHALCPKGEESWCFYNRAIALGLPESEKDHIKKNLYRAKIPQAKLEYIKEVYRDLGNPDLLKRCLRGATQNPNESLHSKVWNKCPKIKFYGRLRVLFLVQYTSLAHNFGYEDGNIILHMFGSQERLQESLHWQDLERARHATPKSKKKRKQQKDEEYQPGEY